MHDSSKLTNADRDACLPIIDLMMECSTTARSKGVLALEELVNNQEDEFITFAMGLIIDGTDPCLVKGILETLIHTEMQKETHTEKRHQVRKIITEGVLSVQAGENPRLMEMKLLCFLGESYLRDRGHFDSRKFHGQLDNRLTKLCSKAGLPESTGFINIIQAISKSDIQNVFKEVDSWELAIALLGCDGAAIKTLMECMSARLALMILDDMDNFHLQKLQTSAILEMQEKIIAIINKLTDEGKIAGHALFYN